MVLRLGALWNCCSDIVLRTEVVWCAASTLASVLVFDVGARKVLEISIEWSHSSGKVNLSTDW
jgi:hypothetical protein